MASFNQILQPRQLLAQLLRDHVVLLHALLKLFQLFGHLGRALHGLLLLLHKLLQSLLLLPTHFRISLELLVQLAQLLDIVLRLLQQSLGFLGQILLIALNFCKELADSGAL